MLFNRLCVVWFVAPFMTLATLHGNRVLLSALKGGGGRTKVQICQSSIFVCVNHQQKGNASVLPFQWNMAVKIPVESFF